MLAYVSLWSADLLDVGRAIDHVAETADGFHIDIFDGHNVDELLFGPDFVAAVRRRTQLPLEVHLNVTDPDRWAKRFIDAGADIVTVQSAACPDVPATLQAIRDAGAQPSLGIETREQIDEVVGLADGVDRWVLMGTAIGIKGVDQDPRAPERIRQIKRSSGRAGQLPVFVDGGIRRETVVALAASGADGVVPGSYVFGHPNPNQAIEQLHNLQPPPMSPMSLKQAFSPTPSTFDSTTSPNTGYTLD